MKVNIYEAIHRAILSTLLLPSFLSLTALSSTLFPNTVTLCPLLNMTHPVSHANNKILMLYILLFVFPVTERTHTQFCTQRYAANPSPIPYRTQFHFPSSLPTHLPFATSSLNPSPFYPPFCSPHNNFPPHSLRPVPTKTSFSQSN